MFAISMNYSGGAAMFRQNLAFTQGEMAAFLTSLKESDLTECLYLNTLDSCEVYGVGKMEQGLRVLAEYGDLDLDEVKERALFYQGEGAILHLFQVACGQEATNQSQEEILGLVERAYSFAKELHCTGYELDTAFQGAMQCAKRVIAKEVVLKRSTSLATMVACKICNFMEGEKKVMILGTDTEVSYKIIRSLLAYGDCKIFTTKQWNHMDPFRITVIPFDMRYEYLNAMDIIVSATQEPHYTLTYGRLKALPIHPKQRLFIDLSEPRDLDEDIAHLPNTTILTRDAFSAKGEAVTLGKEIQMVQNAEMIIEEELNVLLKELEFHGFQKELQAMKKSHKENFETFVNRYKETADVQELQSFFRVLQRMEGRK